MQLPLWMRLAMAVCFFAGLLRGGFLIEARPLLAYANNYDQIRYTACLNLAPWRPGQPADRSNPAAPLSRFAFQSISKDVCVASSDLLFSAPLALAWRVAEEFGGRSVHSVRRLGELRLLAWIVLALWTVAALLRANRIIPALGFLVWFALVAMDPANLLYFSTFYAEAAALFGFYLCGIGCVVALARPARVALLVAASGAILLATSKFQHQALPLCLGVGLLAAGGRPVRHVAMAVFVGGLIGLALNVAASSHDTPMTRGIATVNRADFLLLVLLPESSDREHVVRAMKLDDACVAASGKSVYLLPGPVETVCSNVAEWSRAQLWWLLLSDPPALARSLLHIPRGLLPWIPNVVGVVEGGDWVHRPGRQPTLSRLFGGSPWTAAALLALPWLIVALCLLSGAPPQARAFAMMCATGSSAVALVALLGDGDVELAKHAHLSVDYALASLGLPLVAMLRRVLPIRKAA